ncbi:restriction endonuclease subunit S [Alicyclobacillus fastidiosus]|uniref:Restriction endonuclease subunit S n=1 Tax=Alicyclobacillus fastidiosus TaxID=392011 RepID=A0ABY6ZNK1_9BACL|nr:restriction endonuclease subunit S [Alicyclobacillus fastidiosus]WAH44017.1 restriction endonuclease subunit S [Alicyclobacillus fastidiosus]GMA60301.1 hypothetical protein GCM10025859_07410 [Alicyclobacillus fastidiosus]
MSFDIETADYIKLDEVTNVYDSLHQTPTYSETGIPMIRVTDIKDGMLDLSQTLKVEVDVYKEFTKKYRPQMGDIVVSRVGSYGKFSFVNTNSPFCLGQNTAIINPTNIDNRYLYYCLISNVVKNQIEQNVVGSTQKTLSLKSIKALEIPNKKLDVQKKIASILSSLDDKIEVNTRMNKVLEQIAQIIFKQWFVDFEFPNENGQRYKSSGGEMVWCSELDKDIPKGWSNGTVEDLGMVVGGGTPSKDNDEFFTTKGIPWITPRDLSTNKNKYIYRGSTDITELGLKNSSATLMPEGTVLFSSRAPIGYTAIAACPVTTNQGFKSIVPKSNIPTEFVYNFLKENLELIESMASGSTFKEVSGGVLKRVKAIIPNDEILEKFKALVTPLGDKIKHNEREIVALGNLRDTLLSKLMSGEIDVSTVEHELAVM